MSRRRGVWRRLTLRTADGKVYLNRWGVAHDRWGGVLLHHQETPDPGVDLHDHPWVFWSVILWGGYEEQRTLSEHAPMRARMAARHGVPPGYPVTRRPFTIRRLGMDECHRVVRLRRRTSWSLVVRGPVRQPWGFFLPDGWMEEGEYDATVRAGRRDMWSDQNEARRPW